ncbi:MAG: hypothetical protein JRD39_04720 [Deltaproteobacteria bacterium]|jgi:hypothetical protein|nr:hypothetical protein [Deltaproteobacteria bacterium]
MKNKKEKSCETHLPGNQGYEPLSPRRASGNAPVLVEIICERVHCVLYDYAINTVDMIVDVFGDLVDIETVIRQGNRRNAQRYLDLCSRAGQMLPVPTILINGKVAFTSVPHPNELEASIKKILIRKGFLQNSRHADAQAE